MDKKSLDDKLFERDKAAVRLKVPGARLATDGWIYCIENSEDRQQIGKFADTPQKAWSNAREFITFM